MTTNNRGYRKVTVRTPLSSFDDIGRSDAEIPAGATSCLEVYLSTAALTRKLVLRASAKAELILSAYVPNDEAHWVRVVRYFSIDSDHTAALRSLMAMPEYRKSRSTRLDD